MESITVRKMVKALAEQVTFLILPGLKKIYDATQAILKEQDAAKVRDEELRKEQLEQRAILEQILAEVAEPVPGPAVAIRFKIIDPETGQTIQEGDSPLNVVLNRRTKRRVIGTPVDSDGNPTTLDQADQPTEISNGNPAVTLSEIDLSTLSFTMEAGGAAGIGPISITGDADRDAGEVTPISGVLDVTVPPGDAIQINFQVGPEEAVPPAGGGGGGEPQP